MQKSTSVTYDANVIAGIGFARSARLREKSERIDLVADSSFKRDAAQAERARAVVIGDPSA